MDFSAALDKLVTHYSERFEILRNVDIAGITVPAVAVIRHRGQATVMGFPTGREGPEACEYVFILEQDSFDNSFFEKIAALVVQAEQEYVKPGKDHAFTFLSVIVLAGEIQPSAAALLKKYKYRRDYGKSGWALARVAVLDESGAGFCNRDGADLKKLVLKII